MTEENDNVLTPPDEQGETLPAPEAEVPPAEAAEPEAPEVDEAPDPDKLQDELATLQKRRDELKEANKYWKDQTRKARDDYFKSRQKPEVETRSAPSTPAQSKPTASNFNSDEEYLEALTDWKVENKRQEWEAQEQQAAQNNQRVEKRARLEEEFAKGATRFEDFEDVVFDPTVPITHEVADLLADSDDPAALAYYLAKHTTEAVAIARMSPTAAARRLAKIEGELVKDEASKPKPKKISNAPPPIKPLGGGAAAVQKNPEKMSQREFEEWRNSQGAKRW